MEYSKMTKKELINEIERPKEIGRDLCRGLNSWIKTRRMEKEMKRLKKTMKKE